MGANFYFEENLPTSTTEAPGVSNPWRQFQLLTHGGKVLLRFGPVNKENSGTDRHTVELTPELAPELASALNALARA